MNNKEEAQRALKEIQEINDSGMTCAERLEAIRLVIEDFYYGDDECGKEPDTYLIDDEFDVMDWED